MYLYSKELSNIDTKKINKNNRNNLFIDAGLNMILKEKIGLGITLTNNETKNIMKVMKY